MSFILEALRKSEQERLRHQTPGMADLRARNSASGRRYWLPLVIFLVGINIGLLLFLWLNATPPASAPGTSAATADHSAPIARPVADSTNAEPVQTQAGLGNENTPGSESVFTAPTELEPAVGEQQEPTLSSQLVPKPAGKAEPNLAPSDYAATPAPAVSSAYGNLPTLTELTLAGSISLAPLHIDMHVFSPKPAERFVFINMNKYHEGDSLREGPVLTAITQDGVILDYQGRSFLVTRE